MLHNPRIAQVLLVVFFLSFFFLSQIYDRGSCDEPGRSKLQSCPKTTGNRYATQAVTLNEDVFASNSPSFSSPRREKGETNVWDSPHADTDLKGAFPLPF